MRYSATSFKYRADGRRALNTTLLTRIKKRPTDIYLVMVEKMRLDHLAHKFYENPNYWWVIASANNIAGSMYVKPGTQLRIPQNVNEIVVDHNKVNSKG